MKRFVLPLFLLLALGTVRAEVIIEASTGKVVTPTAKAAGRPVQASMHPAVVRVEDREGIGTGFAIAEDAKNGEKYFLTCAHCVKAGGVTVDGVKARVAAIDEDRDLAVVVARIRVRQSVFIGSGEPPATCVRHGFPGGTYGADRIALGADGHMSRPGIPGMSGGPVLGATDGKLYGIVSRVGHAIPVDEVRDFLAENGYEQVLRWTGREGDGDQERTERAPRQRAEDDDVERPQPPADEDDDAPRARPPQLRTYVVGPDGKRHPSKGSPCPLRD